MLGGMEWVDIWYEICIYWMGWDGLIYGMMCVCWMGWVDIWYICICWMGWDGLIYCIICVCVEWDGMRWYFYCSVECGKYTLEDLRHSIDSFDFSIKILHR